MDSVETSENQLQSSGPKPHLSVAMKPARHKGNRKKGKSAAKSPIRNWNWKLGREYPAIDSVESLKNQPKFTEPKPPLPVYGPQDYISWLTDPKQSLIEDPDMVSGEDLEKQLQSSGPMPVLPVAAKATSDLKSDLSLDLLATTQPQKDPLQNQSTDNISWLSDPTVEELEKHLQSTGRMPSLPVAAKATSDLKSDPPGRPATIQPQKDPFQNQSTDNISWSCDPKQSLIRDPDTVSVEDLEKQLKSTGPMPALPVAAEATSDLKSDPPLGLSDTFQLQKYPLQNQSSDNISGLWDPKQSLIGDRALVSVEDSEKQLQSTGLTMSALLVAAKATSNLKSDPPTGLRAPISPQLDPLQTQSSDHISGLCDPKQSLIGDLTMISVEDSEKQLQSTGLTMSALLAAAKATSDLKSDLPTGLRAPIPPQMDPLQNQSSDHISGLCDPKQSLIGDPAMVLGEDMEKQLQSTGSMPALLVTAKASSDLKSDPHPAIDASDVSSCKKPPPGGHQGEWQANDSSHAHQRIQNPNHERIILEFLGDKKLKIAQLRKQLNDDKSYPGSFKTVTQLKDFLTNRPHLFVITDHYVQRFLHYNQDKTEQDQIKYNHPGLPDTILPQMDPLQNQSPDYFSWLCDPEQSLIGDPAMVLGEDLEKKLKLTGPMPSLPVAAEAASDLESDVIIVGTKVIY